jgi:hypothetical protein
MKNAGIEMEELANVTSTLNSCTECKKSIFAPKVLEEVTSVAPSSVYWDSNGKLKHIRVCVCVCVCVRVCEISVT